MKKNEQIHKGLLIIKGTKILYIDSIIEQKYYRLKKNISLFKGGKLYDSENTTLDVQIEKKNNIGSLTIYEVSSSIPDFQDSTVDDFNKSFFNFCDQVNNKTSELTLLLLNTTPIIKALKNKIIKTNIISDEIKIILQSLKDLLNDRTLYKYAAKDLFKLYKNKKNSKKKYGIDNPSKYSLNNLNKIIKLLHLLNFKSFEYQKQYELSKEIRFWKEELKSILEKLLEFENFIQQNYFNIHNITFNKESSLKNSIKPYENGIILLNNQNKILFCSPELLKQVIPDNFFSYNTNFEEQQKINFDIKTFKFDNYIIKEFNKKNKSSEPDEINYFTSKAQSHISFLISDCIDTLEAINDLDKNFKKEAQVITTFNKEIIKYQQLISSIRFILKNIPIKGASKKVLANTKKRILQGHNNLVDLCNFYLLNLKLFKRNNQAFKKLTDNYPVFQYSVETTQQFLKNILLALNNNLTLLKGNNKKIQADILIEKIISFNNNIYIKYLKQRKIKIISNYTSVSTDILADQYILNQMFNFLLENLLHDFKNTTIKINFDLQKNNKKEPSLHINIQTKKETFSAFNLFYKIKGDTQKDVNISIFKELLEISNSKLQFFEESNHYKLELICPVFPIALQISPKTQKRFRKLKKIDKSILIVDDQQTNISIMNRILNRYHCISAFDGSKAIDNIINNPPFDIIFMDINMPIMDGRQAVSEIRALGCNLFYDIYFNPNRIPSNFAKAIYNNNDVLVLTEESLFCYANGRLKHIELKIDKTFPKIDIKNSKNCSVYDKYYIQLIRQWAINKGGLPFDVNNINRIKSNTRVIFVSATPPNENEQRTLYQFSNIAFESKPITMTNILPHVNNHKPYDGFIEKSPLSAYDNLNKRLKEKEKKEQPELTKLFKIQEPSIKSQNKSTIPFLKPNITYKYNDSLRERILKNKSGAYKIQSKKI